MRLAQWDLKTNVTAIETEIYVQLKPLSPKRNFAADIKAVF